MSIREDTHKIVATAGLLLIDAMVFHEVIASFHKDIPTLSMLLQSKNLKKELENAWQNIITNINYEPVLDIALRILRTLPASPALDRQLRALADLAYDIASSRVLLRHDLFGRIYHRLLLGKLVKYYATYYTSIPAARLLARLLINLPSTLNLESIPPTYNGEPLRIVDFACGSGTLLSAIYKEVDARARIQGSVLNVDDLHRYLIEEGIWGFDVLHHAVHLAATVLFLHNPVPVRGSKLFVLKLGSTPARKYLGSIDFLYSSLLSQDMTLSGRVVMSQENVSIISTDTARGITLPKFHICIMNPPFTRSVGGNLLFGSLPREERAELQSFLSKLLRKRQLSGILKAGLGAVFVFLADKYLEEGGRMGLVLPRAVLSGVSWEKVREMLLNKYHVEYIITSYEGGNQWSFSENTDLSEVLLVARKKKKGENHGYTIFVNLWKKPSNELESIHIGTQLIQLYGAPSRLYDIENSNASPYSLRLHGKKVGEVYSAVLKDTNFGVYNVFSQMELNRVVLLLRRGIIYLPDQGIAGRIPLTPLSALGAEIGPDRRQVHDAFRPTSMRSSIYKAFWGYDSSKINEISQSPNMSLEPKNAAQARKLWEKRGRLLVVERAWLNTYTVLAVHLNEGVLSNVWWPVKVDDDVAKILALWLNSTLGFLLLSSIAEVTRGPWVEFKKEYLSELPVLDVNSLNQQQKSELLKLYDNACKLKFKALPREFENPYARRIIDEELSRILGLKLELKALYELLSREPMLTG
ncbi:MAG: SAM-dependent methyltransferase [Thermofilum sp.]|nr:SAM-dependent methyltransferase [Thermofilum sp.]